MYAVRYFQMQGSINLLVPLAGQFISELLATNIITAYFSNETGFKIKNALTPYYLTSFFPSNAEGGTGGGMEGQVHVEVGRPGTEAEQDTQAEPAKQVARAEQGTRAESDGAGNQGGTGAHQGRADDLHGGADRAGAHQCGANRADDLHGGADRAGAHQCRADRAGDLHDGSGEYHDRSGNHSRD